MADQPPTVVGFDPYMAAMAGNDQSGFELRGGCQWVSGFSRVE